MDNFVFNSGSKFLDPEKLLFAAGLTPGQRVADLGTGSGFYSLAAGKMVGEQGLVYSTDILESALDHVSAEARRKGLNNLKIFRTDLEQADSCSVVPTGSVDLVILANIIHQLKNQSALLAETYRMLKTGGRMVVVEWNDTASPIGPAVFSRVKPDEVARLAASAALKSAGEISCDTYHYGLIFIK